MVFLSLSSNLSALAVMVPIASETLFLCFRHSSRFSSKSCHHSNIDHAMIVFMVDFRWSFDGYVVILSRFFVVIFCCSGGHGAAGGV